ncbi:MAG: hypothetical protein ABJ221_12125, partial [Haloferula sp.]
LGFKEASRSGCSIGIVDMVVPEEKPAVIKDAYSQVEKVTKQYRNGVITDGERYQKVVDIWTHASDTIASLLYRKLEHNDGKPGLSPLYMMVDSGARGNRSQIKQLSGMRGLMAKPSGEIIEHPITSNFREGLSVLEYFISTHGARKGLTDTALKTADSGYMTGKLVDVAQDVIVTQHDCETVNGILIQPIYDGDEESVSLATRIYGRVSCETVKDPVSGEVILATDDIIDENMAAAVERIGYGRFKIRSVLTCEADRGCCAKCYGLDLATSKGVKIGEAVGIIAAQSIGEPGTQLTMRTFHVGGVATSALKQPIIKAKHTGYVVYKDLHTVESADGKWVVLNKNGSLSIRDKDGLELESHNIVIGCEIEIKDGEDVKKGATVATWDPYNVPIITEKAGKVEFRDMIAGITVQSETDKETGKKGMVVTEHKEDLHPQVIIIDPKTNEVRASYSIPVDAHLSTKEGGTITGGTQLAKTPRKVALARNKDITGSLPRVAELFEARKPNDACVIAKIDGEISFGGTVRGKKKVIATDPESGESVDHLVPMGRHIIVTEGDSVKRGDQITEGPVSPEDLLEACGAQELQERLVNEVQSLYRVQGVEINDKHIEIIIRQMLRKVKISDPGDAVKYLSGDQIDRSTFIKVNEEIVANGGKAAEAEPVLLGITKASLETDSFISAASFQDTTRVLTEAATLGKIDYLTGLRENVIMGHLIPAGTGFDCHRDSEIEFTVEEPEPIVNEEEENDGEVVPLPSDENSEADPEQEPSVKPPSIHGDQDDKSPSSTLKTEKDKTDSAFQYPPSIAPHMAEKLSESQIEESRTESNESNRSPVSSAIPLAEETNEHTEADYGYCEFSGESLSLEMLSTSRVSGRSYRKDQTALSSASGITGHISEFVTCEISGKHYLLEETEKSDFSGQRVWKDLLITSDFPPYPRALTSEMEICEVTGKRLLRTEVETSEVSGIRANKHFMRRSELSGALALATEGAICKKTGRWMLHSELLDEETDLSPKEQESGLIPKFLHKIRSLLK